MDGIPLVVRGSFFFSFRGRIVSIQRVLYSGSAAVVDRLGGRSAPDLHSGRIAVPVDCAYLHLARETRGLIPVVVSATWMEERPPRVHRMQRCWHFLHWGICSPVANYRTCAGTAVRVTSLYTLVALFRAAGSLSRVCMSQHQQRGRLRVTESV